MTTPWTNLSISYLSWANSHLHPVKTSTSTARSLLKKSFSSGDIWLVLGRRDGFRRWARPKSYPWKLRQRRIILEDIVRKIQMTKAGDPNNQQISKNEGLGVDTYKDWSSWFSSLLDIYWRDITEWNNRTCDPLTFLLLDPCHVVLNLEPDLCHDPSLHQLPRLSSLASLEQ